MQGMEFEPSESSDSPLSRLKSTPSHISPEQKKIFKPTTKSFECLICPQAFSTLLKLISHIREHECKYCGNLFSEDIMGYHLLECPNKKTGQYPDVEKLSSYLMHKHYPEKGDFFILK